MNPDDVEWKWVGKNHWIGVEGEEAQVGAWKLRVFKRKVPRQVEPDDLMYAVMGSDRAEATNRSRERILAQPFLWRLDHEEEVQALHCCIGHAETREVAKARAVTMLQWVEEAHQLLSAEGSVDPQEVDWFGERA